MLAFSSPKSCQVHFSAALSALAFPISNIFRTASNPESEWRGIKESRKWMERNQGSSEIFMCSLKAVCSFEKTNSFQLCLRLNTVSKLLINNNVTIWGENCLAAQLFSFVTKLSFGQWIRNKAYLLHQLK